MTLVKASELSHADMLVLGNNIAPTILRDRRQRHSDLAAVNRSLEHCGEAVDSLSAPARSSRRSSVKFC